MPRSGSSFALFVLIFATAIQNAGAAALNVLDAWVRFPPPRGQRAAVYFTVRSVRPRTAIVGGAEASRAGMALLHASRISNGALWIRMLDTVLTASWQSVLFTRS